MVRAEAPAPGESDVALPGKRTKNGHANDVPLSPATLAVVHQVPRIAKCPLAFSLGRKTPPSGFGNAKTWLDDLIAEDVAEAVGEGAGPIVMAAWTVHDLRRTMATGLQRLGVRLEVMEAVLNHVSATRSGIMGVY